MLSKIFNSFNFWSIPKLDNIINSKSLLDERHYIYLLREREFIKCNEQIYKIGKTTQNPIKRFNQYPKSSDLIFMIKVHDCHKVEKKLLSLFDSKFKQRKDIGREYYSGNVNEMILLILNNIN
jgi:hypothetical protein